MGIVRVAVSSISKRRKKGSVKPKLEDSELTRQQSWRRPAGGVRPGWKSVETIPFSDGQEYSRSRLEAWLQRRSTGFWTQHERWQWVKLEANGFRVVCRLSSGDTYFEEICMEDILGIMCTHPSAGQKESEIERPHERSAYFRRTNLHSSEDASGIDSLVNQVEAEYLSQSGQAPQATGKIYLLDLELTDNDFVILTTRMGFYRGAPIVLRASCMDEKEQWVETLRRIIKFESASHLAPLSFFAKIRRQVYTLYTGPTTQLTVAMLICINFVANILEAQSGGKLDDILEALDLVFTGLFTFELIVNLFATLFAEFFADPWNYFDSLVVSMGLVTLAVPDLPGGSTLKLMRTFRVFRLFKRIPSLKHLVGSIFNAIPAMANVRV